MRIVTLVRTVFGLGVFDVGCAVVEIVTLQFPTLIAFILPFTTEHFLRELFFTSIDVFAPRVATVSTVASAAFSDIDFLTFNVPTSRVTETVYVVEVTPS